MKEFIHQRAIWSKAKVDTRAIKRKEKGKKKSCAHEIYRTQRKRKKRGSVRDERGTGLGV